MKKIFILILLILFTISNTSCDYKDIDRRIFIVAMGVDSADNDNIKITLKGAIPPRHEPLQQSNKNYQLIELEAKSIGLGLRRVKEKLSLEPDYSHMKTLVLGESYVNEHIGDLNHLASFFILRRDFQNMMWVTIGNPSAKDILDIQAPIETFAGSDLFMRFGQGVTSPYNYKKKLSNFYTELNTPGLTTLLPVYNLKKDEIKMGDIFIINDNVKSYSAIKDEDVKIFNILSNKQSNSAFIFTSFDSKKTIGFNLRKSKTTYSFKKDKDILLCNVDVKLKLLAEEGTEYNLDTDMTSKLIKGQIQSKINTLLEKFKKEKVDPLNLQLNYWQFTPSYHLSDDWAEKLYSKMQFNVNVDVKIDGRNSAR